MMTLSIQVSEQIRGSLLFSPVSLGPGLSTGDSMIYGEFRSYDPCPQRYMYGSELECVVGQVNQADPTSGPLLMLPSPSPHTLIGRQREEDKANIWQGCSHSVGTKERHSFRKCWSVWGTHIGEDQRKSSNHRVPQSGLWGHLSTKECVWLTGGFTPEIMEMVKQRWEPKEGKILKLIYPNYGLILCRNAKKHEV